MRIISNNKKRYEELDGIRGIAAFIVFLSHATAIAYFSTFSLLANTPIHTLWDGHSAVIMFFVLSGFVLTLPYTQPTSFTGKEIITFLLRRLFRIYPAYFVAVFFSLFLKFFLFKYQGLNGLSYWITLTMWTSNYTSWTTIIKHILMIGPGIDTQNIDPVLWTLVIEMRFSIIFPVILYLIRRVPFYKFTAILTLVLWFIIGLFTSQSTFSYIPIFLLGSVISKYHKGIIAKLSNTFIRSAFGFIGILLYASPNLFLSSNPNLNDYVTSCGSILIILTVLSSEKLKRLLIIRPINFLGKISFSFYLLHLPILITLTSILYPMINSIFLISALGLALSIISSYIVYQMIEVPFINLGRKLKYSA